MNLTGLIIGLISLAAIGIWHPIVIKAEYHLGSRISGIIFFLVGLICIIFSIFIENIIVSSGFAVFGFAAFWGIKEAKQQEERVKKGWFPKKG